MYSSDGGNFEFDGVAPGNYVIEVQLDGYDAFNATVTVSRAPVISFSVGLTKSARWQAALVDSTISAHQLTVPAKARDAYEKGLDLLRSKADYVEALVQFQHAIRGFPQLLRGIRNGGRRIYVSWQCVRGRNCLAEIH